MISKEYYTVYRVDFINGSNKTIEAHKITEEGEEIVFIYEGREVSRHLKKEIKNITPISFEPVSFPLT